LIGPRRRRCARIARGSIIARANSRLVEDPEDQRFKINYGDGPMKRNLFCASYERGCRLAAVECPLPYLVDIPGTPKPLLASEPNGYGYLGARAFNLCRYGGIGYVVGLRLATELSNGVRIREWEFDSPWPNHSVITWGSDARCFLSPSELPDYEPSLDSDLWEVLATGRRITRGHPVEGLLCGTTFEAIPESIADGAWVPAKINLFAETGGRVSLSVLLSIDRRSFAEPKRRKREPLFAKPDVIADTSEVQAKKAEVCSTGRPEADWDWAPKDAVPETATAIVSVTG
jgi:hypothetical protein